MAATPAQAHITRWFGPQHPTAANITRLMKDAGLRPYLWKDQPNARYGVRSHGYTKVLYVVEGTLEITLPDANQRVKLRAGDRIDLPAGTRHGTAVCASGAVCIEAALSSQRVRRGA